MPNPCPHCRRPVRLGAKFCGFCGASLVAGSPAPPPASAPGPAPALPPAAPSLDLSASVLQRRLQRKRRRLIASLAAVLVICLAIAIPLAIYGRPLIQNAFSPAPAASTATHTLRPAPTNTRTPRPSPTPLPSATPTFPPSPTNTQTPSATPTRLMPPTRTSTASPWLLRADFSQPLDLTWESWGVLTTEVMTGTTPALLLNTGDVDSGGISSLNDQITLSPWRVITFSVDVDYVDDDTAALRFAWSPGDNIPPELPEGLPLTLLIESKQLSVQVVTADGALASCTWALEDSAHTFRLEFVGERLPLLFIDDIPACEDQLAPLSSSNLPGGRIHFSGRGLLQDVSVSLTP